MPNGLFDQQHQSSSQGCVAATSACSATVLVELHHLSSHGSSWACFGMPQICSIKTQLLHQLLNSVGSHLDAAAVVTLHNELHEPHVQAAQVRKSSVGGLGSGGYHPNTHHAYTVHSGTKVEQVQHLREAFVTAMFCRHWNTQG